MTRDQKFTLFLAMAIIGGLGIGLSPILVVGQFHNTAPDRARIIAGTLMVAFAMAWACFFAGRAHFRRTIGGPVGQKLRHFLGQRGAPGRAFVGQVKQMKQALGRGHGHSSVRIVPQHC